MEASLELERLTRELENFQDIAKYLLPLPGEVPRLQGIDVWGGTLPLNGSVGGDHIIYVDFKQRFDLEARIARAREGGRPDVVEQPANACQRKAGIAVIDVAGHRMTDALLAAMLHQAFLLGAIYELDTLRADHAAPVREPEHALLSVVGRAQVRVDDLRRDLRGRDVPLPVGGACRSPSVFSNQHDRFMEVSPHLRVSFPPLGMLPSLDVIDRSATDEHARLQGPLRDEQVVADGRAATSCCCTPTA